MGEILANWDESDGSPYNYHLERPTFKYEEPTWRIVPYDQCRASYNNDKKGIKSIFVGNLRLWTLHLIENVEISTLITHSEEHLPYIDIEDENINVPLKVYLDYPFSVCVEAEIFPLRRKELYETEYHGYFPVGYLFWQVAKVYADIYKNHWEEVGVWGHGLSDLIVNGCEIYEDYSVMLVLSS